MNKFPKILIVSDAAWEDENNIGNTFSNIFSSWPSDNLAHVYAKPFLPDTNVCSNFFQISETRLIKKIYNKKEVVGQKVLSKQENDNIGIENNKSNHNDEIKGNRLYSIFKKMRFNIFLILRELLWGISDWKTSELEEFIIDFNPDLIVFLAKDFIYMNKIQQHISKMTSCPKYLYFVDDVYTKHRFTISPIFWIYNYYIRRSIRNTVHMSDRFFGISEKMISNYEKELKISMDLLTKGYIMQTPTNEYTSQTDLIRLIYAGNLYDGRWSTLKKLANQIEKLNKTSEIKFSLDLFTGNDMSRKKLKFIEKKYFFHYKGSVSYEELTNRFINYDVLVHVEGTKIKDFLVTRLSFSTKLIDYMMHQKPILGIGRKGSAPLEYLDKNSSAEVCYSDTDIIKSLIKLTKHNNRNELVKNANNLGNKNHNKISNELLFIEYDRWYNEDSSS